MARCHITRFQGPPTAAPLATGDHWVDELNGISYVSVGTTGVTDWVAVGNVPATNVGGLQAAITANTTVSQNSSDITAIQSEQTTQNTGIASNMAAHVANAAVTAANMSSISAIQTEQTTQNTDIATNTTNISSNDTDISAIQTEQTTQNTDISANTTAINNHIADVANPHATTLLNLGDVDTTAYAGGNRFFKLRTNAAGTGVELFETFEASVSRTDPLLHQPATFEQYLTLTANIPVAGEYLLLMSHRFSLNATNVNFESHVLFNGQFFLPTHVEPKDSFGTGLNVANTTGGTTNTGTDNFDTRSGLVRLTLPVGTASFTLEFRGQTANQEATVYEAEMYIKRLEV